MSRGSYSEMLPAWFCALCASIVSLFAARLLTCLAKDEATTPPLGIIAAKLSPLLAGTCDRPISSIAGPKSTEHQAFSSNYVCQYFCKTCLVMSVALLLGCSDLLMRRRLPCQFSVYAYTQPPSCARAVAEVTSVISHQEAQQDADPQCHSYLPVTDSLGRNATSCRGLRLASREPCRDAYSLTIRILLPLRRSDSLLALNLRPL